MDVFVQPVNTLGHKPEKAILRGHQGLEVLFAAGLSVSQY